MKRDFQRQSPDPMGRTEQRSYSHEGVSVHRAIILSTGVFGSIVQSNRIFGGVED